MTVQVENQLAGNAMAKRRAAVRRVGAARNRVRQFVGVHLLSSLTRRIVVLNLVALVVLVSGILYLNQFRAGLTEARVESLLTQGEIIAGAIAASATREPEFIAIAPDELLDLEAGQSLTPIEQAFDPFEFAINPERVAPIITRLVTPTRTRARVYDRDGSLVVDSRQLYPRRRVPGRNSAADISAMGRFWNWINAQVQRTDLPVYEELGGGNGKGYPEVVRALDASAQSVVRVSRQGELIVSVAVPIQRDDRVYGALLLSTAGGDIDAIVNAERLAIVRVFVVLAVVTTLLSILLAGTIAAPLRRLADAADRVRVGVRTRPEIPDYTDRGDEIGHLSRAIRDMTSALYNRIEAIESFAADVSHELKNPLTSLRSAVETLPLAKTDEAKAKLATIIQHDVKRLDRLISDIANASRLDAELARQDAEPIDLHHVLETVVNMIRDTTPTEGPQIVLEVDDAKPGSYVVCGHDIRLGQVFSNLVDNARSFCAKDGTVQVRLSASADSVAVVVDDDGPGIGADQFERIFERFYTDRPTGESFGQNSGLGLSISKQIVEAHDGTIVAENREAPDPKGGKPKVAGARFIVTLPRT